MPLSWKEWSALVPNGQMVDHPEVLRVAESLRCRPEFWAWADSDGPTSLRATAHIVFAAMLRLSAKYKNFSYGMGCRIPAGPALDDEMGVSGLYVALKESGMIESETLAAGTATVRAKEAQEQAEFLREKHAVQNSERMGSHLSAFLDRMGS